MYKKIVFSSLMMIAVSAFAQQNQTYNGWGDSDNNYSNQSNSNDNYYNDNDYPDDYYYDYPTDYYPQTYYQSYYNDYQNSIISINWNQFFVNYHLNRHQIQLVINLNNRYRDFASWNYYYGRNPDRWYYERFNALRFILGPTIFVNFQNHYYHGRSPVVYFQNYRRTYYVPRYHVNTQYRNVNIVRYRVDRDKFRQDRYKDPRANNGLYDPNYRNNSNGLQNKSLQNSGNNENDGFRNGARTGTTQPERNVRPTENNNSNNGGFRSGSRTESTQPERNIRPAENNGNNGGFRNNNVKENTPRISQNNGGSRSDVGFRNNSSNRNVSENRAQKSEIGARGKSDSRGGGLR